MIRPRLPKVASGTRLTTNLVNGMINRTEYAADLLRQYKLIAGTEMYVEPHYDGTRVSYYYPVGGGAKTTSSIPPQISPYIPFTISWATFGNSCIQNPWTITNSGTSLKMDIADSANCGGSCGIRQTADAIATIVTGTDDVDMNLSFGGIVELQTLGYDRIRFSINGGTYTNIFVAEAASPGGGLQCIPGNATTTYLLPPPYRLIKNTGYSFGITFDTIDELYHVGCFYTISLSFTKV